MWDYMHIKLWEWVLLMNGDGVLCRICFGICWVMFFIVRLYYQKKITSRDDYSIVNKQRHMFFFRIYALAYLLLPFYFLTSWLDGAQIPLTTGNRIIGAIITISGIALFAWSHHALGQNWTAIPALSPDHQLTVNGPFHFVRHPMYSSFFIIGVGFSILSANWIVAIAYLGSVFLMYRTRITEEEKMLVERFGDGYIQYMQKTGRLFPKLF